MIWDELSWDEELILLKEEPEMEIPEDKLFYFLNRYPQLKELIDHFNLQLEY